MNTTKEQLKKEIEAEYRINSWGKLESKKLKEVKIKDGIEVVESGLNVWSYHIIALCIYLLDKRSFNNKRTIRKYALAFNLIIDIHTKTLASKASRISKLNFTKNTKIIYEHYHNCDALSLQSAIYKYYDTGIWDDEGLLNV